MRLSELALILFIEFGRGSPGTENAQSEMGERVKHTKPQGGENPTALTVAPPLGNPRLANHTTWRPIITELVFVMSNAGSLLNTNEELADLVLQKN